MAFITSKGIAIKGLSACVPKSKENIRDIYKWDGVDNFVNTTGINSRRRSLPTQTSADFCFHAADRLIEDLGWDKNDIDALIFVSQTPDYILPASSCLLQQKLGLKEECYTLDISLGCSGWVYALSVITSLMQNGDIKKGLLLAGDTVLKTCSPEDKSTYPLFGDAGTATALEFDKDAPDIHYSFYTDGSGYETIIINDGGYRNPTTPISIPNHGLELRLDGMNVFSFGINKAPKSVNNLIDHFGISKDDVELFTFHQANLMMNEKIRKKLKLEECKVPYSLQEFANTSCASIPLTLVTQCRDILTTKHTRHITCGFGVGLSWGAVYFETDKIVIPNLIEL